MKKSIRIMSFKDRYHHTSPLFKELEILPLAQFIDFKYCKFIWKLVNGFLPPTLASNFKINNRLQLFNSISRLESLGNYVRFAGPRLWNDLPVNLTAKTTLNTFSKHLKVHLLDQL